MLVGCILLAVAALVVVAVAVCWLAGVQMMALVKGALTACAVLLTLAGAAVVTSDVLRTAGYFDSARGEPTPPPSETLLLTDLKITEQQQLGWMHEHTVGVFIEGQGFGMGRMRPNLTDIVTARNTQADDKEVAWGGPYVREAGKGKVHNGVQDTMANGWMGGLHTKDGTEMWKVRQVYLLGLVKHPQPVVYLTDKMPDMKETKDVPTREPDAFEKAALETLRGGEAIVIEKSDKSKRVLGPIFAGKSCVKCHDQKGQMLGAFTYELERVPVEK